MEECRAILLSEYLMDNKEVLGIFGYTDTSEITAEDRELYHRLLYAHNFTDPLQFSSLHHIS